MILRPRVEERLLRGARNVQESPAEGDLPFSPNLERAIRGEFLETSLQFGVLVHAGKRNGNS